MPLLILTQNKKNNSSQSKMCRRCLRSVDEDILNVPDYASSIACTEDGDEGSLMNEIIHTSSAQHAYRSPSTTANQVIRKFVLKLIFVLNKFY